MQLCETRLKAVDFSLSETVFAGCCCFKCVGMVGEQPQCPRHVYE